MYPMPRTVWISFMRKPVVDLAAQMADINVHDVRESVVVHVPDVFYDHGAAQRPSLVAHHVFEDAEFLGGQIDGLARARNFAADAIERQVGHLQAFGRGLAAAQQRAYAGQQFHEGERLHQVIVGALFEPAHAIVERSTRAQNQHGRSGFTAADAFEHLQAVHIRQHNIQDHQVVVGGMHELDGGHPVRGSVHRVAGALQAPAQKIRDALFVFHYQQSHDYSLTQQGTVRSGETAS